MRPKARVLGKATELVLTPDQHQRLLAFTTGQGGYQTLCRKVYDSAKTRADGNLVARVYEADMERIRDVVNRPDSGGWQDLFREIMGINQAAI